MRKFCKWASPYGFVDYPIIAACRCIPELCSGSACFSNASLRSKIFVSDSGDRLSWEHLLNLWSVAHLPSDSYPYCSITRQVWGPIAEVIVRGRWPAPRNSCGASACQEISPGDSPRCRRDVVLGEFGSIWVCTGPGPGACDVSCHYGDGGARPESSRPIPSSR